MCSDSGWLVLKCSTIGAETNCGIAQILGILLMNSMTYRYFEQQQFAAVERFKQESIFAVSAGTKKVAVV